MQEGEKHKEAGNSACCEAVDVSGGANIFAGRQKGGVIFPVGTMQDN